MSEEERAKVVELLDALQMTAYGISTDMAHYKRLAKAVEAVEKVMSREINRGRTHSRVAGQKARRPASPLPQATGEGGASVWRAGGQF